MKFEDTKLPDDPIVVKAFSLANENNKTIAPELTTQLHQQFELMHQQQLFILENAKDAGQLDEEKFNQQKSRLDLQKKMQVQQIPLIVQRELDNILKESVLAPAQEIQNHSENTSPAVLAAALLLASVRDPIDYLEIDAKFGAAVSGPLGKTLHITAHPNPEAQKANLEAAGSDEKRLYMAEINSSLSRLPDQIKAQPPGRQLMFPPQQEEVIFRPVKQLWGNDKKQDARLVDVFNKAATAMKSAYRIELDANGAPDLVKNAQDTPPKMLPGPTKKPPTIKGDDGF